MYRRESNTRDAESAVSEQFNRDDACVTDMRRYYFRSLSGVSAVWDRTIGSRFGLGRCSCA